MPKLSNYKDSAYHKAKAYKWQTGSPLPKPGPSKADKVAESIAKKAEELKKKAAPTQPAKPTQSANPLYTWSSSPWTISWSTTTASTASSWSLDTKYEPPPKFVPTPAVPALVVKPYKCISSPCPICEEYPSDCETPNCVPCQVQATKDHADPYQCKDKSTCPVCASPKTNGCSSPSCYTCVKEKIVAHKKALKPVPRSSTPPLDPLPEVPTKVEMPQKFEDPVLDVKTEVDNKILDALIDASAAEQPMASPKSPYTELADEAATILKTDISDSIGYLAASMGVNPGVLGKAAAKVAPTAEEKAAETTVDKLNTFLGKAKATKVPVWDLQEGFPPPAKAVEKAAMKLTNTLGGALIAYDAPFTGSSSVPNPCGEVVLGSAEKDLLSLSAAMAVGVIKNEAVEGITPVKLKSKIDPTKMTKAQLVKELSKSEAVMVKLEQELDKAATAIAEKDATIGVMAADTADKKAAVKIEVLEKDVETLNEALNEATKIATTATAKMASLEKKNLDLNNENASLKHSRDLIKNALTKAESDLVALKMEKKAATDQVAAKQDAIDGGLVTLGAVRGTLKAKARYFRPDLGKFCCYFCEAEWAAHTKHAPTCAIYL